MDSEFGSFGDLNNDGYKNLVDIAFLIDYLYYGGNGPFPFMGKLVEYRRLGGKGLDDFMVGNP